MSPRDDGSRDDGSADASTPSDPAGPSNGSSSSNPPILAPSAIARWVLLLSPLFVPWVVVRTTETTLLFPWGMVWLEGATVVPLPTYLDRTTTLPHHLRMWLLGVLCYASALAWAGGRRLGTDQRVTAGLFVLVALATAWLSSGLAIGPNRTALPLGSIHAIALAAWVYVAETEA